MTALLIPPSLPCETVTVEEKQQDHIRCGRVFILTETHAPPHFSSSHNWKHLGMKIESRWHINGRVLQGHADKKRLLLLTGRVHDRVTGPP